MNYFKLLKIPFFIFLVVYFLYLVISTTPAAWAVWGVHQAAPNLWLSSVKGTLWRGEAQSAQIDIGPATIALGEVKWKLNPWSLLLFSPCVDFSTKLPKQNIEGTLCQKISGNMVVKNSTFDAPVNVIKEILPVQVTGVVSMQIADVEFNADGDILQLDGQFSWQNARAFTGDAWITLGSFAAKAEEDGEGGMAAEIFDLDGPYKTALNGHWDVTKGWNVSGTLAPQQGASDIVQQGLQVIGEELSDGVYKVQWPL